MRLPGLLLAISAVVLAITGVGYLLAPGLLLLIVGIESAPTTDFLLRTEGVALVSAAIFVWSARHGRASQVRLVLLGLALYYVTSSVVDLVGFAQDVVGLASMPSAIVRIVIGGVCAFAALRLSRSTA